MRTGEVKIQTVIYLERKEQHQHKHTIQQNDYHLQRNLPPCLSYLGCDISAKFA